MLNSSSKHFFQAHSRTFDSSEEADPLANDISDYPPSPTSISPEISFFSPPESPTPSADDNAQIFFDHQFHLPDFDFFDQTALNNSRDFDRDETLRGSYDSFFKTGYHKRSFDDGSEYESDISSEGTSDLRSSTDSERELESDDDIPSIRATAVRVKITPLRAVRRTVRRSYLLDARPRKSSAEEGMFNPYWRVFLNARDAPPGDAEAPNRDAGDPPLRDAELEAQPAAPWGCLTRKLSINNLKRVMCTLKATEYQPVGPLDDPPTPSIWSPPTETIDEDIDIVEFHDVTQEAARMAAMMSFKWEFKPAPTSSDN